MLPKNICISCMEEKGDVKTCPHCGYNMTDEGEASIFLNPGTVLAGKYMIGKVLGQGGFGITYIAWDINLDIRIAVKEFFPQGLVSRLPGKNTVASYTGTGKDQFSSGVESFLKEAKTLARFENHPNIVTVRDFFKENNTAYMVMSYIEGLTLEAYLAQEGGKINIEKTISIIIPVMDALKEVHEAGIIHGDISSDNIYIDKKGCIVLTNFGAARQEMRDKSKSFSVILKTGYALGEQFLSKGEQGPWTDVYSVAATMYRCITGHNPLEAMGLLAEEKLPVPSKVGAEVDPIIESIIVKAMSLKADMRYQNINDFQLALKIAIGTNKTEMNSMKVDEPADISVDDNYKTRSAYLDPKKLSFCCLDVNSSLVNIECPVEVDTRVNIGVAGKDLTVDMHVYNYSANSDITDWESETVVALKMKLYCYDSFNEPCPENGANIIYKVIQDVSIKPDGELYLKEVTLPSNFNETRRVEVTILSVLYASSEIVHFDEKNLICLNMLIPKGDDLKSLRVVAGNDAVCYGRMEKYFWQCVCGRGNSCNRETCIRCKRDKKYVTSICASKITVEEEIRSIEAAKEEEIAKKEKEKELYRANYFKRPLWKKFIGFRTQTTWKMIAASISYFFVLLSVSGWVKEGYYFTAVSVSVVFYIAVSTSAVINERLPVKPIFIATIVSLVAIFAFSIILYPPKSTNELYDHLRYCLYLINFGLIIFTTTSIVFSVTENKGVLTFIMYLCGAIAFIVLAVTSGNPILV